MEYNINTNTVSAICPQCGARQEVDPAQDAAICRYCGKPFSVERGLRRAGGAAASPGPGLGQAGYSAPQKPRKKRVFWWIVGWIFCFPIPLTILIARSPRLNKGLKIGIIAAGWLAYLLIGLHYRGNLQEPQEAQRSPAVVAETTPRPTARPTLRPTARPTPKPTAKSAPTPAPADAQDEEEEYGYEEEYEDEEEKEESGFPDVVTPEFKEAMDSYEAFFDEYCEFMKAMSDDPTDFTMLMKYADFMSQYAETMDKLDAIGETDMSPADEAYYLGTMARIEVKLLEAANYTS